MNNTQYQLQMTHTQLSRTTMTGVQYMYNVKLYILTKADMNWRTTKEGLVKMACFYVILGDKCSQKNLLKQEYRWKR